MDKDTRNRIERAAQAARGLLEQDFADQLEGVFDIRASTAPWPPSRAVTWMRRSGCSGESWWRRYVIGHRSSVISHQRDALPPTTDD